MSTPSTRELILEDLRIYTYSRRGRALALLHTVLFSRGFQLLLCYRLGHWARRWPWGPLLTNPLAWLSAVLYSCEIHFHAELGRRLRFEHPLGIVIGRDARVGDDVLLYQHVTLGTHGAKGRAPAYPTVGDGVTIYAHSTVIGGIILGAGAVVGAHSLVLHDVPSHSVVAGAPARVVRAV